MDLLGTYTSSSSRSSSPPPTRRYGAEINAHLNCVAVLSPHQRLVEVVDMERPLAHCSEEEEELVLVGLEEEATTLRRETARENAIARKFGLEVISHHSEEIVELDSLDQTESDESHSPPVDRGAPIPMRVCRDCIAVTALAGSLAMGVVFSAAYDNGLPALGLSALIVAIILGIFGGVLAVRGDVMRDAPR
jgi:hypothetical protein